MHCCPTRTKRNTAAATTPPPKLGEHSTSCIRLTTSHFTVCLQACVLSMLQWAWVAILGGLSSSNHWLITSFGISLIPRYRSTKLQTCLRLWTTACIVLVQCQILFLSVPHFRVVLVTYNQQLQTLTVTWLTTRERCWECHGNHKRKTGSRKSWHSETWRRPWPATSLPFLPKYCLGHPEN